MLSITDIANRALSVVGAEGTLLTMEDASKEGRLCKLNYDLSRRAMLRMHPWNFAIGRVALSPSSTAPAWGANFYYPLPVDCLRVLKLDDSDLPYKIEGRTICCSLTTVNLKYVIDVTDPLQFDSLFIDCLAQHLALKICYSLTQSNDRVTMILKELQGMVPKARFIDASEDYPTSLISNEFDAARIGPNRGWVRDPMT